MQRAFCVHSNITPTKFLVSSHYDKRARTSQAKILETVTPHRLKKLRRLISA